MEIENNWTNGVSGSGATRRVVGVCLLAVLVTFANTLTFDFVSWDDPFHVTNNRLLDQPGRIPLRDHLLTPEFGYPIPVTMLSYQVETALFGRDSARPFHATNLLIHLINVLLVFMVARRLGLGLLGAALSMVIFGLHPVVAEPVSWVTGRKDLLAGLLALWAVLEAMNHPFSHRQWRSWIAPGLFLFACLSKPVVLFLVLLIPIWQILEQTKVKRALIAGAPIAVIAAIVFPIALLGQAAGGAIDQQLAPIGVLRKVWYALGFHTGLVGMIRVPSAIYWPLPWPPPFDPAVDLLPLLALGLSAAGIWWLKGLRRRAGLAGLAWVVLAYLPSSSLIPITRYLADVYLYLPIAGVGWFLGALLEQAAEHVAVSRRRWVTWGAVALLALILAFRSHSASARWENSLLLWSNTYELYPNDPKLCRHVGYAYIDLHRPDLALDWFKKCGTRFDKSHFVKDIETTSSVLGRGKDR